jgi:hypothetical protein
MRKTLFILVLMLSLIAGPLIPAPAFSAVTAAGSVPADITAIVTDGTYNFIGTGNGKIYKQTVSGGAISATLVGTVAERITGLQIVGTSLYVTTSAGKVYYIASASTGVTFTQAAVTDNLIVNADINSAAAIDASKIGGGGVSTTEFDYLGAVTSNVQTQINSKQATVTEGSLTDSVIVSADIKDNTVAKADLLESTFAVTVLDNVAGPAAAQMYNSLNVVNEAITVTLPTAVAGMSGCVLDRGSAHDVIVDVQSGDTITLLGAVDTAGDGITNASGSSAGDYVCVVAMSAGTWVVMSRQGTWAQQ